MDVENKRFGSGPRELSGAVDLISEYKLRSHHDFLCMKTPLSLPETHYLCNVVGNTEIKRGEGMELDQLFRTTSNLREKNARITTFDLEILREAFQMRDSTRIDLSSLKHLLSMQRRNPTSMKLKGESKCKERKYRKHKDHHKDKYRSGHHDSGPKHQKKQHNTFCS